MMIEPLLHDGVRFCGRHPAIDKHDRQLQLLPVLKIAFDHRTPGFFYCFGDLRISISRQIHKIKSLVDKKEVDRLRPAWRGTRASQAMGVRQNVQQAGFANVRSATKSDLRSLISGKVIRSRCTLDESGGADFHDWQSRGRNLFSL